jgi:hypothetical protein
MWEFVMVVLLVGALVLLIGPRLRRRGSLGGGGGGGDQAHGTLLITGVSPRPDADGEQFVTISGLITGPTVNEHHVYQRMAVDVNNWPAMGALIPVVYSAKNPDKWAFAPQEPPPAPPQYPQEAPPQY